MLRLVQQTRPVRLKVVSHQLTHTPYRPPRTHVYQRSSFAHISTATFHPRNLYQRTISYFNSYPFVKYSLLLCGAVLGGSLAFESYSKHRKKQKPQILSLPPRVGHATLPRPAELQRLGEAVRMARRRGEGVVYLTGPRGSGKTEIVCQYGKQFVEKTHNFTYRFRIAKPAVLYVDGSSCNQLYMSLQEAVLSLGLSGSEFREGTGEVVPLARAVQEKLAADKIPWLIIVDNLTPSTLPTFQSLFHSSDLNWNWRMGHVVVTSHQISPESNDSVVSVDSSLRTEEALSLLQTLCPSTDFSACSDPAKLSPLLSSSPLALALAASTVNLYTVSLEQEPALQPRTSALDEYLDLLGEQVVQSSDVTAAYISLYVEAATTQPRVLHVFDLFGAVAPGHPVPVGLVDQHLSSPFYRLSPLQPPNSLPETPPQDLSYWAQLKLLLPFGKKPSPPLSPLSGFDRLHYLRQSPILNFKKYSNEGFELVQVHPAAVKLLSRHLVERSAALLDRAHLKEAEEVFDSTAWFRQYRVFDKSKSLAQYWSSLPGVSRTAIPTREVFQASPVAERMQYSDYLHSVSHSHRVISSIVSQLKMLDDGFAAIQYSRYIEPHLSHLCSSNDVISDTDRIACSYGLASIASLLSPRTALALHQAVLDDQRRVLSQQHPAVARSLTDIAGLLFVDDNITGARSLLESALEIYQALPPKLRTAEVNVDCGLSLASLAVVVSCQGERQRSHELLEQALGLYQTVPESGDVSIYQRRLVAATLTDLAHAYLSLGKLVLAQKYVELAMMAVPNLYPDGSQETVRALSVAGAVYALLGDRRESQRVGEEAGKHRAKQQLVFM